MSWIDYFKNNDNETLVFINANIKSIMDLLENFYSNFNIILSKIQVKNKNVSNIFDPAIKEINKFCKLIEESRKNFMASDSIFNIRTVFDNLKNTKMNKSIRSIYNFLKFQILIKIKFKD